MGINRVSMYATFGNKEALFVKAMERFTQASGDHLESCLAAGSAHGAVEKLLREAVAKFTNLEGPGVCFLTQRAPDASERTRRFVERKRACVELGLQRRFDRAVQDGELPSTVDAGALARFYSVTVQGLALQAQHGGTREELLGVVAIAMGAWPRALA
jgi:AcrR family transcriptional regulator